MALIFITLLPYSYLIPILLLAHLSWIFHDIYPCS